MKISLDKIKEILVSTKIEEPPLPIGDFHSINTYAVFKDKYIDELKTDKAKAKKSRGVGKTVGLSLLYGGSEYTLTTKIDGLSMDEASDIIKNFYANLPYLKELHKQQKSSAKNKGYVRNLLGGIRYLPFAQLKKAPQGMEWKMFKSIQSKAERLALNAPIQNISAHQLLLILIVVNRYVEKYKLNRTYGNLRNNYHPYTRVVGIPEDQLTDQLISDLEELENGTTLFVLTDSSGKNTSKKWDKLLSIPESLIKKHNIKLIY